VHRFLNQVIIYYIDINTRIYFVFCLSASSHQPEVILIDNKREETFKTQQTPGSVDEAFKVSTTPISPKPVRQRERSGVETDDDELLAQIQKVIDSNAGIGEEELLKEKIIEARLIAQCKFDFFFLSLSIEYLLLLIVKTIYDSFMNEKENLTKLEQQMNEKPLDLPNITPTMSTTSENGLSSNQTVDILQELLSTIKHNNQLEVLNNFHLIIFNLNLKSKVLVYLEFY
jgi:hypothetical protein